MSLPGFGGAPYTSSESRALSTISETPGPDLSQGQEQQIRMLQEHDAKIRFLAAQVKQTQKGVDEANQNPIQQIEQFIADVIILLGGGELAQGALDFGDLQYILPALGALFGFGDGPFPISLFEAAEKFFLGYVVPQQQFVDVINNIITAWAGVFGIDPKFVKDVKALITSLGDLFDGINNLFPSLNQLFDALGISGSDLGPLGQALSPIIKLFTGLDLTKFGSMIEFITDAIDPFIVQLTAVINFINSVLAVLGYDGDGGVVNSPLGDLTNPFTNLVSFLADINFNDPSFDPIAAAEQFITNILNPTGLLTSIESVIQGLFGISGGDSSLFNTLGSNLMALLGNPNLDPSGTFDPIATAEQMLQGVLTPAGALSTFTQIPANLFGLLNTGAASSNLLPDGSFDDASAISGLNDFTWSSDGCAKAGSVWTTGTGVLHQLIGVPIPAVADDIVQLSTKAKWSGVSASAGNAIVLACNAYDASDTLISDPSHRVVAAITAPGAASSSYAGHDAGGWVALSGQYQAPAGTTQVRMSLEVAAVVNAGNIGFDDCVLTLDTGIFDAALLKNTDNVPFQWLGTSVAGFAGISDLIETFQHYTDGLGSAFTQGGSLTNVDLPTLFTLAQDQTNNAITAAFQAALHTVILGNRTNKSAGYGANPTSQGSLTLDAYSNNGTLTTMSVTAGNAVGHRFTVPEFATYGFLEFQVFGTSLTNILVNIYKIDPTTNVKTALFNSANIAALIGTSNSHVRVLLPGMPQVQASDELLFEIVNNGTNALTVVYSPTAIPNNTNEIIQNTGWTRTVAAGGASPTSLTSGQGSYSGNVPYAVIGIANVPANYQPPVSYSPPSSGDYVWTPPSWQANGDIVDLVGCGAGGGGGGSFNAITGQGGRAGTWNGVKLVVGTDIKLGSTVAIHVGVEGTGGSAFLGNGTAGQSTTFTYQDPGGSFHTMTCAGGAGGANGGASPTGVAPSPNPYVFDLIPYFGGAAVGANTHGNAPGGGGGGAPSYGSGSTGSDGGGWVRAAQP